MRRFIALSSLAVVICATAQTPVPARAATTSAYIVDGHGWGHGRGMGQYGARGLAQSGVPWNQILLRYYTGVHLQRVSANQWIRVLLDHVKNVVVKGDSRATITDARGHAVTATRRGAVYFEIARSGGAMTVSIGSSPKGPWRRVTTTPTYYLRVKGSAIEAVVGATSSHWYRGVLDLQRAGTGIDVVNTLALDRYVSEVTPREMPAAWPLNALRAQAVAARTYVLRVAQVARASHRAHDICGTTACQVFGGYARAESGRWRPLESVSSNKAVASTAGVIMTYGGKPILAEYSSSTGGYTTSGGFPYLAPRPDPTDASSPMHSWSETVSFAQIKFAWPSIGAFRWARVIKRDGRGDWGGRVKLLEIVGTHGRVTVSGNDFAIATGLLGDWFRFRSAGGSFRFTRNLGYGAHDAAVLFLQERLRAYGYFPKSAKLSSYFGPITRDALKRYQRAQHINPTGFLGPATRARLNASK